MHSLLPEPKEIRVIQQLGRITAKALEPLDQLLLILPAKGTAAVLKQLPQGAKLQAAMRRRSPGSTPALVSRLPNKRQTLVVGGTIANDASAFDQLSLARKLVSAATAEKAGCLGVAVVGFDDDSQAALCGNVIAAALASAFSMPEYKSKTSPARIRSIRIVGLADKVDLDRVRAEASGNNIARWLTALPPNKLDATGYADALRVLAKDNGWQAHILHSSILLHKSWLIIMLKNINI